MARAPETKGVPDLSAPERVRELIRSHSPSFWRSRPLPDELRLDDSGIGFDSVGLVELLAAFEREFDVALPGDIFLEDEMTVGQLAQLLLRAVPAATA
ncbi:MAG: acyl carrier protein [Thermoanaerobaculia bacterium]